MIERSIEGQLADLPKVLAANGWVLACEPFVDDGVSGSVPGRMRPGMSALLSAIDERRIDIVAIVTFDRVGRESFLDERMHVLAQLQRRGVLVAEGHNVIDLQTPEGELYAIFRSWEAAQYLRRLRQHAQRGRNRMLADGKKPAGPVPYGYQYHHKTGQWAIDPTEGPIAREMFERVITGDSCRVIATDLDIRGVVPRRSRSDARRTWKPERVLYMIHSTTYRGEYPVDKEKGIILPVPAIVNGEVWTAAQRALTKRRSRDSRTGKVKPFLLRGLLSCSLCGQLMRTLSREGPSYYACRAKITQGLYGICESNYTLAEDADQRAWARIVEWLQSDEGTVAEALQSFEQEVPKTEKPNRSRLEVGLKRLDQAQADALAQYRRGIIPAAVRDRELEGVAQDRARMHTQLQELDGIMPEKLGVDQICEALQALSALTDVESFTDKRAFLEAILPPLRSTAGGGQIWLTVNLGALVSAASGSPGRTYQDEHAFEIRLAA
jgi:site-specific DNA recombinase